MFVHQTRLRHLLRPHHYYDDDHYQLELERLFLPSWQFACTRQEVANPGDFVTLELLGTPVLIRNFDGEIKAFENVCPHRHSMLTCESHGNCPVLKCQYHGWQFDDNGRTGKIPEAKAFRPWDRENAHLKPIRLDRCGDLIFITLSPETPDLADWFAPLYQPLADSFASPQWKMAEVWEFDCPCNWKVPTENTLESYHISEVHPKWLGGELPAESGSQHQLDGRFTTLEYQCDSPIEQRQTRLNRYLGAEPKIGYRHWHFHPNMAFCLTDTFNYFATCVPTGTTTCRVRTRMFPLWGDRRGLLASLLRQVNWKVARRTMRGVFLEDLEIFSAQQRGIEASDRPGVIGTREERIFQFQSYVCDKTGLPIDPESETLAVGLAKAQ